MSMPTTHANEADGDFAVSGAGVLRFAGEACSPHVSNLCGQADWAAAAIKKVGVSWRRRLTSMTVAVGVASKHECCSQKMNYPKP